MNTDMIQKLLALACYTEITEEDFSRVLNYQKEDFAHPNDISLSLHMLHEMSGIVDILCEGGEDAACLIDYIVEPSLESLEAIQNHFPVSLTPKQAQTIVLKHYLQKYTWQDVCNSLVPFAERMMAVLEMLDLLYWTNLTDKEYRETHPMTSMYPSFSSFCTAVLNVYTDNVGFDATRDATFLNDVQKFHQEALA